MSFDFGENAEWNSLLLRAEIAASTSRVSSRKSDKDLALTHFEKLVSISQTRDGKIRALVGVVLCCISLERYERALEKAARAVKITKCKLASGGNCCRYVKNLALETYNLAARRFNDSLNAHR